MDVAVPQIDRRPTTGLAPPREPVVEGPKAALFELVNSDIPELQRLAMSPVVRSSWRTRGEYWSPAELQGRLASDSAMALVARLIDEPAVRGVVELLDLNLVDRRAQLGIVLDPELWATGVGMEIALLFLGIAFDRYPIEKVGLMVFARNQRLVPGLGRYLDHEGRLARHVLVGDRWEDVDLYAIWRSDLAAHRERFGLPSRSPEPR